MENWKGFFLKAAGVGTGFAMVAAIIIGITTWWARRPAAPWNTQAISPAGKNELEAQTTAEIFHLRPVCNFKNNTDKDYRMAAAESGTLMSVNPDNGGLDKLDHVTWDGTIVIPAGQTVNVKFDISYNLDEYGETASGLADMDKLTAFADKRLKRIKDLKFFDYTERYEIDCPGSWATAPNAPR